MHFKVLLNVFVLNRCIKFTHNMKKVMKRDFWSTENLPADVSIIIVIVTILLKFVVIGFILFAIAMCVAQFVLNVFPKWPFISEGMYPYYKVAYIIFALGEFIVIYNHTLIFMYHCYHSFCQTLILKYYIKQMAEDFPNLNDFEKEISTEYQAAVYSRMLFGIHQHVRLVR